MELLKFEDVELPPKTGKRLLSIYRMSPQEIALFEQFEQSRLAAIEKLNQAQKEDNREEEHKARKEIEDAPGRILFPWISSFLAPQGFNHFYSGCCSCAEDIPEFEIVTNPIPIIGEEAKEQERFKLYGNFWLFLNSLSEGQIKIEPYIRVSAGHGCNVPGHFEIITQAYQKIVREPDGKSFPIIKPCGLGLEIAEAKLVGASINLLKLIYQEKLPIDRLRNLTELNGGICKAERDGNKTIADVLRTAYEDRISRFLFPKSTRPSETSWN